MIITVPKGFKDIFEFNKMVCDVDLSTPEARNKFKEWQDSDGSKEGLDKLLKETQK